MKNPLYFEGARVYSCRKCLKIPHGLEPLQTVTHAPQRLFIDFEALSKQHDTALAGCEVGLCGAFLYTWRIAPETCAGVILSVMEMFQQPFFRDTAKPKAFIDLTVSPT